MKTKVLTAAFALVSFISLNSCKTSHFANANQLKNVQGIVYLNNDQQVEGRITVQMKATKPGYIHNRQMMQIKTATANTLTVPLSAIKGYQYNNEFYALKQILTNVQILF